MEKKPTKKERSEAAALLGRRGSRALIKKRGKGYMKKLAKLGGKARWANR